MYVRQIAFQVELVGCRMGAWVCSFDFQISLTSGTGKQFTELVTTTLYWNKKILFFSVKDHSEPMALLITRDRRSSYEFSYVTSLQFILWPRSPLQCTRPTTSPKLLLPFHREKNNYWNLKYAALLFPFLCLNSVSFSSRNNFRSNESSLAMTKPHLGWQ